MRFFKKKKNVIDLTDYYKKRQEKLEDLKRNIGEPNSFAVNEKEISKNQDFVPFPFANAEVNNSLNSDENFSNKEERKRKANKILKDITEKIEDLSNSIYHLEQRIEVLEKKMDINKF
jgi:predicted RNA-binding protein Jag